MADKSPPKRKKAAGDDTDTAFLTETDVRN